MTMTMTTPTLPRHDPAPAPSVPTGVEYHRALAGDRRRVGRGLLAIALLAVGFVAFPLALGAAAAAVDVATGRTPSIPGDSSYTPLTHAAAMLALGLLVPWTMLIQRVLYGVPAPSLHSVASRLRLDLVGWALLVLGPVWVAAVVLGFTVPGEQVPWSHADLVGILLGTLLLTPLQAAGEEYGIRGLMFRVVGSWARGPRAGLIAGVVVTTVVFTAVHGATDPLLIAWYLVLFGGLAVITWRTGGLEVAIVLHAILNTVTFAAAAYFRVDLGGQLSSRATAEASTYQLVPTAAIALATAIVWWRTRRTGPVRG